MKYLNVYRNVSKTTCSALLCAGVFTASFSAQAAVEIQYPSQKPLSLTEGVPPNLLVTLDDSGSMAWAYTPDAISGKRDTRAGRSNVYNANYYDPDVVYKTPKKIAYVGTQIKVTDYEYGSGKDLFFTSAPRDGFNSSSTRQNLSNNYQLQWGSNSFSSSCNGNVATNTECKTAHYFKYTQSAWCPAPPSVSGSDSCYTYVKVNSADQQRNFTIWYSFYRNRNLATRSAANLAFYTMPDNVRLTWGALNSCYMGNNSGGSCYNNKMDRFAAQHRVNFFKWLDTFGANGGTPLHKAMYRAGEFVRGETSDTSVCRANYHVLMTDGMWNGRANDKADADSTAKTLPDGTAYTGVKAPYWDGHGHTDTKKTLADSAFFYWANDLRPDLTNKIAPYMPIKTGDPINDYWDPRNNPATWQHMVNFTVGLGLSNSLTLSDAPAWDSAALSPTFANIDELKGLGTNGLKWPAVTADHASTIYDLWHAAINSRGEFFSADSPDSLVRAFQQILERISGRNTTGSSPAINSGVGDDGTGYAYQASYAADQNWAGDLVATKKTLDAAGNVLVENTWHAKNLLDLRAPSSRNIKISDGSDLINFTWSNLTDEQKEALNRDPDRGDNVDTRGSLRLDFLRGDRSKEQNLFRERTSVLGDMVNSKPITEIGRASCRERV